MLGNRALISFCQTLALQPKEQLVILFEKHGITHHDAHYFTAEVKLQFVTEALRGTTRERTRPSA